MIRTLIGKTSFELYRRPMNKIVRTLLKPKADNILTGLGWVMKLWNFHDFRDSASSLRFAPPSLKRTRGATLISFVMTELRSGKILSALGLSKVCTILFMGRPYTSKASCQLICGSPLINTTSLSYFVDLGFD